MCDSESGGLSLSHALVRICAYGTVRMGLMGNRPDTRVSGDRIPCVRAMAVVKQMFELAVPPVEALILMMGRKQEVQWAVEELELQGWKNSYSTRCNVGLVPLLCTAEGSRFVRQYWEHHREKGTPMYREKDGKVGTGVKMGDPHAEWHDLLAKTTSVVHAVLDALKFPRAPTLMLDTELPEGHYFYIYGVRGQGVAKTGTVTITYKENQPPNKSQSCYRCVLDRILAHGGTQVVPTELTVSFKDAVKDIHLIHVVPVLPGKEGAKNERWVQCMVRVMAAQPVDPPYFQCATTGGADYSEWIDLRLLKVAIKLANEMVLDPVKYQKIPKVDLTLSDFPVPGSEIEEFSAPVVHPPPATQSPPVAPVLGKISDQYKCKLLKELRENKLQKCAQGTPTALTDIQMAMKNDLIKGHFQVMGCCLTPFNSL